jgi:hypothetical protein
MKKLIKSIIYRFIFWKLKRRGLSIKALNEEKKRLYALYNELYIQNTSPLSKFQLTRTRIKAIEKHLQDIYNENLVDGKQWPPRDADGNPTI